MSRWIPIAIAAAAVVAAYQLGRRTSDDAPLRAVDAAAASAPARAPAPLAAPDLRRAALSDHEVVRLRDEIRAVVRDELAAAALAAAAPTEDALPTAVVADRVERARALLDGALASGRLDLAGHEQLHGLLTGLPRAEQEPLLSALHVALNDQRLVLDLR